MSTVIERALEARVIQLEAEVETLRSVPASATSPGLTKSDRDDIGWLAYGAIEEHYAMGSDAVAAAYRLIARLGLEPATDVGPRGPMVIASEEAAAYHAGIAALARQLGTHVDADIVKAVHDTSPYGADHRKKHLDLSERVKQLEGELRFHRGEVPSMLAAPQPVAVTSLPFEATPHVTAPAAEPGMRLNEIQKREFLIANGWTLHPEIEDQNIRVCWENGARWQTLEAAYEIVVTEAKKAALRTAGWESIVDAVDEIERWKHPSTGVLHLFHVAVGAL